MNANILVETEGLSKEEWLRYRKQGIGGSDVAAILGISKWNSAIQLWLDKTNQTNDLVEENEAMQWGTIMEPIIRNHFAKVTGKKVVEIHAMLQHPEYPYMLADLDGITVDDDGQPAILEIKTASEFKRSEWDEGVPLYYQTQVQHYLCVTGIQKAYVAVLIGGNSFRVFEVNADRDVIAMLIEIEKDFWNKVMNMIRPEIDGSDAAKNLLDSIYTGGVSDSIVLPDDGIEYVDAYLEACVQEDNAKAKKQDAVDHIKEIMGDVEKATCLGHSISWKSISTERFDSSALKADAPDIYEKYCKTMKSRRFTLR